MLPADSPFTDVADIKELPYVLDGSFTWLTKTPMHDEWVISDECDSALLLLELESVLVSAKEYRLTLPNEFVMFVRTPDLHKHLRSAVGCYLSVAGSVLPFADGYVIRFLHDQQGCAFWYVYINADGSDHCVVSSYEYFDADEMDYEIEDLKETDFYFCATSFEAFISQFWIENEIMFADFDDTPLPDVNPKFLELYAQSDF